MKGLELSKEYYKQFGKPMLEADFPQVLPLIAVGFTGSGSDHFGFDDAVSTDHDFEPGFTVFLPDENLLDRRTAFLLERAYAKLPKEFMGVKREPMSPVGGNRHGVVRTAEYYEKAVGHATGNLSLQQWLTTPDYTLAEAVNGELFFDGLGEVTAIRKRLAEMPSDILKKRLAGNLFIMAQAGQYNFSRCLAHGQPAAAQLACYEFVNAALRALFLLHNKYCPYYKWGFYALDLLKIKSDIKSNLEAIICTDARDVKAAESKAKTIESVAADIVDILIKKGYTTAGGNDLIKHAYAVNDAISDGNIRNLHILCSIK